MNSGGEARNTEARKFLRFFQELAIAVLNVRCSMVKSDAYVEQVSDFVAQNNKHSLKLLYFSKRFELNF